MRLIDADKLKSELFDADWMMDNDEHMVEEIVERQSTVDAEPVRHGRWIASRDEFCACSICKYPVYVGWNQTNYCPNCGAKMDLEEKDK